MTSWYLFIISFRFGISTKDLIVSNVSPTNYRCRYCIVLYCIVLYCIVSYVCPRINIKPSTRFLAKIHVTFLTPCRRWLIHGLETWSLGANPACCIRLHAWPGMAMSIESNDMIVLWLRVSLHVEGEVVVVGLCRGIHWGFPTTHGCRNQFHDVYFSHLPQRSFPPKWNLGLADVLVSGPHRNNQKVRHHMTTRTSRWGYKGRLYL